MTAEAAPSGREAQRRRTRRAIVDAAMELLGRGEAPSVAEIAAAAEVSRRTVYLHFTTLDQLLLDATVGLLSSGVDDALARAPVDDARERLRVLVEAVCGGMTGTLPLGRQLVRLTVDGPAGATGEPIRGRRRVAWIESAIAPARSDLSALAWECLVSALTTVVGWEAVIVLVDVRGLDIEAAGAICRDAALALLDTAYRDHHDGQTRRPSLGATTDPHES